MNRHTIAAKKMRAALLEKLGAWCVICGEADDSKLQFDHKFGRDWPVHKFSYRHRMMIYTREAEKGLIRVLCAEHNLSERKRDGTGAFVPTAEAMRDDENIPY